MWFAHRLLEQTVRREDSARDVNAPVFDEHVSEPLDAGPINPFPMLAYVDSADSAPPMPTSLDPNKPRKIPGMGGTPPFANDVDLKELERRKAAEKLLTSNGKDPGTDATKALAVLMELPPDQQGKAIDNLDDKAFENLLDRVGHNDREKFAKFLQGTKNPERKVRLWGEAHKARTRNDIGRKKGDVGPVDPETEYEEGKLISELSEEDQEKADDAWKASRPDHTEIERTDAQERDHGKHLRRIGQAAHTKEEVDREVAALLEQAKHGTLSLADVNKLAARKELEYGVEQKHGVDLTAKHFADPQMEHFSREWSKEDLEAIDLTLSRLPGGHVHAPEDGLAEIHRRPTYHFTDGLGGLHSHGVIDITDWGRSSAPGFRHGGDKREGVSKDFATKHGDKISTLEFVLTHEIGHNVADTHAKEFEKFKKVAGWEQVKVDALQKDRVTADDITALEARRENPNEASTTIGGDRRTYAPEKLTKDRYWAVDRTAIPSAAESAPGPTKDDTWQYARVNPQEHFAEMYAKAVHVPLKLHDEMVARPTEAARTAHAEVEAHEAAIAKLKARNADAATIAAKEKALKAAQNSAATADRAVKQRGAQFSVMRDDVFGTEKASNAAASRLKLGGDRLREFKKQAAKLSTPEQIATLEASFR